MELNIIDSKPKVESVAVITPTVGTKHLAQCVQSVENQTFKNIKHYIVIDGPDKVGDVGQALENSGMSLDDSGIHLCFLPENVGKAGGNWYGHRVYAAFSYLVNADAILFLDEDNWLEPDHVQSLIDTINEHNLDWSYSFRKIFDKEGNYLIDDNCESLGMVHHAWHDSAVYHIDTSSYCVRRDVAVRIAGAWYGQWGADRQYFAFLLSNFPNALPSKKHSLCYRLDGNPKSVTKEFFEKGNGVMRQKYGEKLPWLLS